MKQSELNRLCGKAFEARIIHRAQITGHLIHKNPLAYQYIGQGKSVAVTSELDFTVANGRGQVAFIDAKVVNRTNIPRSLFASHQILRAYKYNRHRVPAGFVVLFRPLGAVYFISGLQMHTIPAQGHLPAEHGLHLGREDDFNLAQLFDCDSNFAATF